MGTDGAARMVEEDETVDLADTEYFGGGQVSSSPKIQAVTKSSRYQICTLSMH